MRLETEPYRQQFSPTESCRGDRQAQLAELHSDNNIVCVDSSLGESHTQVSGTWGSGDRRCER